MFEQQEREAGWMTTNSVWGVETKRCGCCGGWWQGQETGCGGVQAEVTMFLTDGAVGRSGSDTSATVCSTNKPHCHTNKHPHTSSSQRTNSDTTKHCHSCGMRVVTFRDACQPHTGKPNTSLASNTHHHLACRDCVCRGVPHSPKRFHVHNSQPQSFQHRKPTPSTNICTKAS